MLAELGCPVIPQLVVSVATHLQYPCPRRPGLCGRTGRLLTPRSCIAPKETAARVVKSAALRSIFPAAREQQRLE